MPQRNVKQDLQIKDWKWHVQKVSLSFPSLNMENWGLFWGEAENEGIGLNVLEDVSNTVAGWEEHSMGYIAFPIVPSYRLIEFTLRMYPSC